MSAIKKKYLTVKIYKQIWTVFFCLSIFNAVAQKKTTDTIASKTALKIATEKTTDTIFRPKAQKNILKKTDSIPTQENSTGIKKRDSIIVPTPVKPIFIDNKKIKRNDSIRKKDYITISHLRDTVMIDTTLTIEKEYRLNFTRKDLFGKLPFLNPGQVANNLVLFYKDESLLPKMGFTARHLVYYEIEDIKYYRVPTTFSEAFYRTGFEQGQVFEIMLTANTNPNLNFSLTYKGIRSLGLYRNTLVSQGNFRGTVSFQSPHKKYDARMHIAIQDSEVGENGGLTETSLENFRTNEEDFRQRGRLDTRLGAESRSLLEGSRYYFQQRYHFFTHKKHKAILQHMFYYEGKNYRYTNLSNDNFFGDYFKERIFDVTAYKSFKNKLSLDFKSPYLLGQFSVFGVHQTLEHSYRNILVTAKKKWAHIRKSDNYTAGVTWNVNWKKTALKINAAQLFSSAFLGSKINADFAYDLHKNIKIKGLFDFVSKPPAMSAVFFQSNYLDYNWQNDAFKNQLKTRIRFGLQTKWGTIFVENQSLGNYTYFESVKKEINPTENTKLNFKQNVAVKQAENTVQYFKVSLQNEMKFWKFALNNRAVFQAVQNGENILNVPQWVVRSTVYFSDILFKQKSLFLQTGVTVNYFSEYFADSFNPVIGDFTTQNEMKIGNYPYFEIFANAMIKQTRFYIKLDNAFGTWQKKEYFASPYQPLQDFELRFGVVWNFFK